jgi:excisionase family DNA binding protein
MSQSCAKALSPSKRVPAIVVFESPRIYLDICEAARYLRVSVRTVHTLIKAKQLTYTKSRGQLRFRLSWLNDYLDKRTVKAA